VWKPISGNGFHSRRRPGGRRVVNRRGRRFTDESLGDEVSNQAALRQPGCRAVLLFDRVAAAWATTCRFAGAGTRRELVDAVAARGVRPESLRT
jgi:hypothetical protein